ALGRLWLLGAKIDWTGFWRHEKRRRIPLPTYAFDRKRYWVEPRTQSSLFGQDALSPTAETSEARAPSSPRCKSPISVEGENFCAPKDDVETGVAEIWQRLLGVERVGVYDNFFA